MTNRINMPDYQQIDIFSDNYKTLQDLLEIVYKLNPTGGYYGNDTSKPIPPNYQIDTYRDLAFIVEYKNESEENENIIDNAIYLTEVGNGLYKIYQIDGKILGQFSEDNTKHTELVKTLIDYMVKGEVFKK